MIDVKVSNKAVAMTCVEGDALFTGVERALDNGRGFVFVTDGGGVLKGYASLAAMRGLS